MKQYKLYDVSTYIHTGHHGFRTNFDIVSGMPVGGLRYFFMKLIVDWGEKGTILVPVMDSKTDKSTIFEGFKGTRKKNAEIEIQRQICFDLLKEAGTVLKEDNYEADDLIASFVRFRPESVITIGTADHDIAASIRNRLIEIEASNTNTMNISVGTYRLALEKKGVIPWNTILPFYFFNGKSSNNVHVLKREGIDYFSFLEETDGKYPDGTLSDIEVMRDYLTSKLGGVDEELEKRLVAVYPRIKTDMEEPTGIDIAKIADKLCSLNMGSQLKRCGVQLRNSNSDWLNKYRLAYESVDESDTPDFSGIESFTDLMGFKSM